MGFFYVGPKVSSPTILDHTDIIALNFIFAAYLILLAILDYGQKYWHAVSIVSWAFVVFWGYKLLSGVLFGDVLKWIRQDPTEILTQLLPIGVIATVPLSCAILSHQLMKQRVAPFEKELVSILSFVNGIAHEFGGKGAFSVTPRRVLGMVLATLSIAGIIITFVLFQLSFLFVADPEQSEYWSNYSIATLLLLPVFGFALWIGRRLLQPNVSRLLQEDRRAPIVLLRSFKDDRKEVYSKVWIKRLLYFGFGGKDRLEQVIADDLWRLGPFIAIGQPGEKLPPLGASRAYSEDSQWQTQVSQWLEEARLIILIGARTEGVLWELQETIRGGNSSKLLVLMPPASADERSRRWQLIARTFEGTTWQVPLGDLDIENALAVSLHENERVTLIRGNSRQAVDYELAVRLAIYAMFTHEQ